MTDLTICLDSDLLEQVSSICLSCTAVNLDEPSVDCVLHSKLFECLQHLGFESMGAWQHGMSAKCICMSASKLARTLKVAHGRKCLVAEHSKLDTPEDLKDLLKRVDNTLQQLDTVCGRELSEEEVDQLDVVTEGRQRSLQLRPLC